MNHKHLKDLLLKYHCHGGRYSIFPHRQDWKKPLSHSEWLIDFEKNFKSEDGIDLYIHIPFCESLCTFCGCNISITKNHSVENLYIDNILNEWKIYTDTFPNIKISSIYLGGGTPNFLNPDQLDKLLSGLKKYHRNVTGTIEADPRHITFAQLKILNDFQFKKISFGVQDFDEKILKNLNRMQSYDQVTRACDMVRDYHFDDVSLDLIYGLPMQTIKTMEETLHKVSLISPTSIALYPLATAPWQEQAQRAMSIWEPLTVDKKYDIYIKADELLTQFHYNNLGFGHYTKIQKKLSRTIMGFTPTKAKQLIGLGVSAISYSGSAFIQNEKVLAKYNHQIKAQNKQTTNSHHQDSFEKSLMFFFEELICNSFTTYQSIHNIFDSDTAKAKINRLEVLHQDKLIKLKDSKIIITELGKHFMKNICQIFG